MSCVSWSLRPQHTNSPAMVLPPGFSITQESMLMASKRIPASSTKHYSPAPLLLCKKQRNDAASTKRELPTYPPHDSWYAAWGLAGKACLESTWKNVMLTAGKRQCALECCPIQHYGQALNDLQNKNKKNNQVVQGATGSMHSWPQRSCKPVIQQLLPQASAACLSSFRQATTV